MAISKYRGVALGFVAGFAACFAFTALFSEGSSGQISSGSPIRQRHPSQINPETGQVIEVLPFFIDFKCEGCEGGWFRSASPPITWTLPRARDFESKEYKQVRPPHAW